MFYYIFLGWLVTGTGVTAILFDLPVVRDYLDEVNATLSCHRDSKSIWYIHVLFVFMMVVLWPLNAVGIISYALKKKP
jgi:hypothetical protein